MPLVDITFVTSLLNAAELMNFWKSFNSFAAHTKLVPQSLKISTGQLRLDTNRFKAAKNAEVERELAISIWIARVEKQTKMQI
jgi:hypothetical protein